jgi:hypothetical protein
MNTEQSEQLPERAVRRAAPEKARAPLGGWAMYPSTWGQRQS